MTSEEWAEIPEHKPQTAVSWLQEAIERHLTHEQQMQFIGLWQHALEMEKEQIMNAYYSGSADGSYGSYPDGESYYNQTYGQ